MSRDRSTTPEAAKVAIDLPIAGHINREDLVHFVDAPPALVATNSLWLLTVVRTPNLRLEAPRRRDATGI